MSAIKIPALNPLRWHQIGVGDFWQNSIPFMEAQNARYPVKMKSGDMFTLQFLVKEFDDYGTVYAPKVYLLDEQGTTLYTFSPVHPVTMPFVNGYYVYYRTSNLPSLPDGVYYFKLRVYYPISDDSGARAVMNFYSEPIWVKDHENTVLIKYSHSQNDFDCVFSDAAVKPFCLRLEGGVRSDGFTPGGKYEIFNDLDFEPVMLQGTPYNTYKWSFGPGGGLPNYIADKLNRIFACDQVTIDGVGWMRGDGSKLEGERDKSWPMGGWSLDLVKTENENSEGFDLEALTFDMDTITFDSDEITWDQENI